MNWESLVFSFCILNGTARDSYCSQLYQQPHIVDQNKPLICPKQYNEIVTHMEFILKSTNWYNNEPLKKDSIQINKLIMFKIFEHFTKDKTRKLYYSQSSFLRVQVGKTK